MNTMSNLSKTLSFHASLWMTARSAAAAGRRTEALAALQPLLKTTGVATRLHYHACRLAARIHFESENYKKARNALRAALRVEKEGSWARFELAVAWECDPYGCDRRALLHFARAAKLEPLNGSYQAALGRSLLRNGRRSAGIRKLLAAAAASPADVEVLSVVVDALCEAGKPRLALRLLNKARFLIGKSLELARLDGTARYAVARRKTRSSSRVLPFLRVASSPRETIRHDSSSRSLPHLAKLRGPRIKRV